MHTRAAARKVAATLSSPPSTPIAPNTLSTEPTSIAANGLNTPEAGNDCLEDASINSLFNLQLLTPSASKILGVDSTATVSLDPLKSSEEVKNNSLHDISENKPTDIQLETPTLIASKPLRVEPLSVALDPFHSPDDLCGNDLQSISEDSPTNFQLPTYATLDSPSAELTTNTLDGLNISEHVVDSLEKMSEDILTGAQPQTTTPLGTKRKRPPSKAKKDTIKPAVGDSDLHPNGTTKLEVTYEDEDTPPPPNKRARRSGPAKAIKVDEKSLILTQSLVKKRKGKKNKYNLTHGISPYPNHAEPTLDSCKVVYRLLAGKHGEKERPVKISPPSLKFAGCGNVPDVCDAILRTLLSMSTKKENANAALEGLVDKFGVVQSGSGEGSVDWKSVHEATQAEVKDAIKRGGLAERKSSYIKAVLNAVYQKNCSRRDQLIAEREALYSADTISRELIETKILNVSEDLLSMNYLFEMATEDAMEAMLSLTGVGVKTASCVLLMCMQRPSFAVDTHVLRFCKWLGWVPDEKGTTADSTFSHCEVRVPDELKYGLHLLFWEHGRECGRCKSTSRPGTEEWNSTVCPIEHLVTRTKQGKPVEERKVVASVKGEKGK